MKKRTKRIWLVAAVLLVGIGIWHWWPEAPAVVTELDVGYESRRIGVD